MAAEAHPLLKTCERALGRALERVAPVDDRWYCAAPEENLIGALTPGRWREVRVELERGKGTELKSKFRAAYSSGALAINAFAPLTGVSLPFGPGVRGKLSFEQERSAWATGFKPTLDVIVERDGAPVRLYVESKCIEYLRRCTTDFSPQFVTIAQRRLPGQTAGIYEDVFADAHHFGRVDARQLLKHFLAAKRTASDHDCRVILLYLFWEPCDADRYQVFGEHRSRATQLSHALSDHQVRVEPLSYRRLWEHWSANVAATVDHLQQLSQRYAVALNDESGAGTRTCSRSAP